EPQAAMLGFDDVSKRLDAAVLQRCTARDIDERLHEAQPLLAIVVTIAIKVLRNEHLEAAAQAAREKGVEANGPRASEKEHLERGPPRHTGRLDQKPYRRHGEQVKTGRNEARGVENHVARDEHLLAPAGMLLHGK